MMVNIVDNNNPRVVEISLLDYIEKVKVLYPKEEEELIYFLKMYKLKDLEVMLCQSCSTVFD